MAEIKFKMAEFVALGIHFNFSSDIRGHISNVNSLLACLVNWSKKSLIFLKDDLAT